VSTDGSEVGVGPHPRPWPTDSRFDPDLLEAGDRRNVVDGYRYWSNDAIVADLAARRRPFHVAIENWQHDLNIGTVVRNANAFLAAAVHIVGNRRWNRRGAMVTDRYVDVRHHPSVDDLATWAAGEKLALIGVDLLPGSVSIIDAALPARCVLLFGQEGPGLSSAARAAVDAVLHVPQQGSTRSINAGVASGIAMYEWVRRHDPKASAPTGRMGS
jgi:tRNA G18 (ribose-2'-O)-methylase SpoU